MAKVVAEARLRERRQRLADTGGSFFLTLASFLFEDAEVVFMYFLLRVGRTEENNCDFSVAV